MADRKRYRGFISYSQKDRAVAVQLHRRLEAYRLPKGVSDTQDKSRKIGRFFRDEDEMGGAADLGAALRGAIADAESLIVICSPAAAQSKWVNEEVLHFKRTGRAERIFAVIVAGKPNSPVAAEECFPPALRFQLGPDGNLSDVPTEPLGINVRGKIGAQTLTRLVAGLLDTPFDTLWRREQRRRRARVMQIGIAAAAGLGLSAAVALPIAHGISTAASRSLAAASQDPALSRHQALRVAMMAARPTWYGPASREAQIRLRDLLAQSLPPWVLYGEIVHPEGVMVEMARADPINGRIVTLGSDHRLRVWDSDTLALQRTIPADGENLPVGIARFRLSRDGARAVTVHPEHGAMVWDVANGQLLTTLRHEHEDLDAFFSSDSSRVVTTSDNGSSARIWSASGGMIAEWEGSAALSPSGEILYVFTSGTGGFLTRGTPAVGRFVSVATGRMISTLPNPDGVDGRYDLLFSPDERRVVVRGGSAATFLSSRTPGFSHLIDVRSGRLIAALDSADNAAFQAHAFSRDSARLITATSARDLEVRDAASGAVQVRLQGQAEEAPGRMTFSADGAWVVADNGEAWSAETGRALQLGGIDRAYAFASAMSDVGAYGQVATYDSSAALWGQDLAVARVWNAESGELVSERRSVLAFDASRMIAFAQAEDERPGVLLAYSARHGHRDIVRIPPMSDASFTGDGLSIVGGFGTRVSAASGLPYGVDANEVCTMSGGGARWNRTGDRLVVVCSATERVCAILCTDGETTSRLVLIDATAGRVLAELWSGQATQDNVEAAAPEEGRAFFSADGARLIHLAADGRARTFNAASGEVLTTTNYRAALLPQRASYTDALYNSAGVLKLHPAGLFVLEAPRDGAVALRNLATGALGPVMTHGEAVRAAWFSADGNWVATLTEARVARVWDVRTQREALRINGPGEISALALSADGARLAVGAIDGSVRIWDVQTRQAAPPMSLDQGQISAVAFNPDATAVAAYSGFFAWLGDARSGEVRVRFAPNYTNSDSINRDPDEDLVALLGLSPDWRRVVVPPPLYTRGQRQAYVLDISRPLRSSEQPRGMSYVAQLACDPNRGQLMGDHRRITREDLDAVPALRAQEFDDVCRVEGRPVRAILNLETAIRF